MNPGPRAQIKAALGRAAQENGYEGGFSVVISVENGEELALQTYNSHLGIIGGISILGTSGIVEPMSEKALVDTICLEMDSLYAARTARRVPLSGQLRRGFRARTRSNSIWNARSSAPIISEKPSIMRSFAAIRRSCLSATPESSSSSPQA
ncbi:MAG: cobalt-precorrin-5B (C(1))-methyltransferase [Butyricicoccaceae bacterium]